MGDEDLSRPRLTAEHAALKEQMNALVNEHERLSRRDASSAERLAHLTRLRENRLGLERHYRRLEARRRRHSTRHLSAEEGDTEVHHLSLSR